MKKYFSYAATLIFAIAVGTSLSYAPQMFGQAATIWFPSANEEPELIFPMDDGCAEWDTNVLTSTGVACGSGGGGGNNFAYPFPGNATSTIISFTNGASTTKLTNLTSNGFVKTSSGDGTLSIDTTTYESGLTAGDGLTRTSNDFDCDTADTSTFGCLTATDWDTFNDKLSTDEDFFITGDGTAGISNATPGIGLGVEVGGNNNAHMELNSPTNGVSYLDFTTVNEDYAMRIGWWDNDDLFNFQSSVGVALTIDPNGNVVATGDVTADSFIGDLTGNADTATALAANGSNCGAGEAPRGVDASGAAENCTAYLTTAVTAMGPAGQTSDGPTVTLATSSDTNIGLTITGSGDTQTFTSNWIGTLADARVADTLTIGAASTVADGALSVNVSLLGQTIGAAELASADFGSFTCNGTTCTIDNGAVSNAMLANSTISGKALGTSLDALTATNGTLTFSGSYDGSTARTVGLNLANTNTWTVLQTFNYASTTAISASGALYIPALATCPTGAAAGFSSVCLDTTVNELQISTSTITNNHPTIIKPYIERGFTFGSTTQGSGTSTKFWTAPSAAGYLDQIVCHTNSFMRVLVKDEAGNRMNDLVASSTEGTVKLISNNSFTANEVLLVDIGTTTNIAANVYGGCTARLYFTAN